LFSVIRLAAVHFAARVLPIVGARWLRAVAATPAMSVTDAAVLGLLVVVPHTADEFFVLGDNTHSIDSRYFGAVKRDAIVGTAALIYRPRSGFRVFP